MNLQILIVDDSRTVRKSSIAFAEAEYSADISILEAETGVDAIKVVQNKTEQPNLIFVFELLKSCDLPRHPFFFFS